MTVRDLVEVYELPYLIQKNVDYNVLVLLKNKIVDSYDIYGGSFKGDKVEYYVEAFNVNTFPVKYYSCSSIDIEETLKIPVNKIAIRLKKLEDKEVLSSAFHNVLGGDNICL